jgi:hypothetical protein
MRLSSALCDESLFVFLIKAAGIAPGAWAGNDPVSMNRLLDTGIEPFYTDNPRMLLSLKAER